MVPSGMFHSEKWEYQGVDLSDREWMAGKTAQVGGPAIHKPAAKASRKQQKKTVQG